MCSTTYRKARSGYLTDHLTRSPPSSVLNPKMCEEAACRTPARQLENITHSYTKTDPDVKVFTTHSNPARGIVPSPAKDLGQQH